MRGATLSPAFAALQHVHALHFVCCTILHHLGGHHPYPSLSVFVVRCALIPLYMLYMTTRSHPLFLLPYLFSSSSFWGASRCWPDGPFVALRYKYLPQTLALLPHSPPRCHFFLGYLYSPFSPCFTHPVPPNFVRVGSPFSPTCTLFRSIPRCPSGRGLGLTSPGWGSPLVSPPNLHFCLNLPRVGFRPYPIRVVSPLIPIAEHAAQRNNPP